MKIRTYGPLEAPDGTPGVISAHATQDGTGRAVVYVAPDDHPAGRHVPLVLFLDRAEATALRDALTTALDLEHAAYAERLRAALAAPGGTEDLVAMAEAAAEDEIALAKAARRGRR